MFGSVKTWWSGSEEAPNDASNEETNTVPSNETEEEKDSESVSDEMNINDDLKKAVGAAKEWGNYFYSFGKKATVAAAKTMTTTAKQFKDTVDQVGDKVGLDKAPVIGEFSKEQQAFKESRRRKKAGEEVAIAPWCGYDEPEGEEMRKQILALSGDERNFLRHPPKGAQFTYDADASAPVAIAVLSEDPQLREMRFKLVPKRIKEEVFWRNYFYRVSLIRQSTDLSRLSQSDPVTGDSADGNNKSDASTESYDRLSDVVEMSPAAEHRNFHTTQVSGSRQRELSETEVGEGDFASDSNADAASYRVPLSTEERRQLGMSSGEKQASDQQEDESSQKPRTKRAPGAAMDEWEEELQRELNEFELVEKAGSEGVVSKDAEVEGETEDADLEREIMEQLEADNEKSSEHKS